MKQNTQGKRETHKSEMVKTVCFYCSSGTYTGVVQKWGRQGLDQERAMGVEPRETITDGRAAKGTGQWTGRHKQRARDRQETGAIYDLGNLLRL